MTQKQQTLDALNQFSDLKYRDIHSHQQLERSVPKKAVTKVFSRRVAIASAVLGFVLAYLVIAGIQWMIPQVQNALYHAPLHPTSYIAASTGYESTDQGYRSVTRYYQKDEHGNSVGEGYLNQSDVPAPEWFVTAYQKQEEARPVQHGFAYYICYLFSGRALYLLFLRLLGASLSAAGAGALGYQIGERIRERRNLLLPTTNLNEYENDSHIQLPEEIMSRFDFVADRGAHHDCEVSTIISHIMLDPAGITKINVPCKADRDLYEDGDLLYYRGDILYDQNEAMLTEKKPLIDKKQGEALFDVCRIPSSARKFYRADKIPYNPENRRGKSTKYKTLAQYINQTWTLPPYENLRPSGAYLVDTAPNNTMMMAITRAGKGQTYILPYIDILTRAKNKPNIIVNDPKGENAVLTFVKANKRGMQPVMFNLMAPYKSDIFNLMLIPFNLAREGSDCSPLITQLSATFFPVRGGDDEIWQNGAANTFKRVAYSLIDYYLEEEKYVKKIAQKEKWTSQKLYMELDEMIGNVSLYNCKSFFTDMASINVRNPLASLKEQESQFSHDEYKRRLQLAEKMESFWINSQGKKEEWVDAQTLFMRATKRLPVNAVRNLAINADKTLESTQSADKMLSSFYGIAITALSYFDDPTISRLTSGNPSQSINIDNLSFPRLIRVRIHKEYLLKRKWTNLRTHWEAFSDPSFTVSCGKEFEFVSNFDDKGWTNYAIKPCFKQDTVYLRMSVMEAGSGLVQKVFHFKFTKLYQTTMDKKRYVKDKVTNQKIIKNGLLEQLVYDRIEKIYVPGELRFITSRVKRQKNSQFRAAKTKISIIDQDRVLYTEKPKILYLITPPHLTKYSRLLLILIKQIFDFNVQNSYTVTKEQKPYVATYSLLDEFGNLASDGRGIEDFSTMASIGLGQKQYFCCILQTLQQLQAIYGDNTNKTIQGNMANLIFLKSNDEQLMETLSKLSGVKHEEVFAGKNVSYNSQKLFLRATETYSIEKSIQEKPAISFNDLAHLPEYNSIVLPAGDFPVWNRNQMCMPPAFALYKNDIEIPGYDVEGLTDLPSLDTAKEIDVLAHTPDFMAMLTRRLIQASMVNDCITEYCQAYHYQLADLRKVDADLFANEIMDMIITRQIEEDFQFDLSTSENRIVLDQIRTLKKKRQKDSECCYGGFYAPDEFIQDNGTPNHSWDKAFNLALEQSISWFQEQTDAFEFRNGSLYEKNGMDQLAGYLDEKEKRRRLDALSSKTKTFNSEAVQLSDIPSYEVHNAFYHYINTHRKPPFSNSPFFLALKQLDSTL